jgi:hypothetical protein
VSAKRIHGVLVPQDVPHDMQPEPPIPCAFKVGDSVTFTNPQGVVFPGHTVKGFSPVPSFGRFVYVDLDCWWYAVKPESLQHAEGQAR